MNHEHRPRNWYLTRAAVGVLCLVATLFAGRVRAEDAEQDKPVPRTTLLAVAGPPAIAAPMNAVIHAALEQLQVVSIVAAPGLDLAAVQLALDCVGQTPLCLKLVAAQERAQVLVSPTLQRLPDALVLSVLSFDTRQGELRRVLRKQSGTTLGPELLDSVPGMLRELFDLPPQKSPALARAEVPPSAATPHKSVTAPLQARQSRGLSAGPLVLAGAGAVSLAAAVGVGMVMEDTQKDYERIRTSFNTKSDAQAAIDARSAGKTQATVANVLFAVGGGALASGLVWLVLDLNRRPDKPPTTTLSPVLAPTHLGVVFTKRGVGL